MSARVHRCNHPHDRKRTSFRTKRMMSTATKRNRTVSAPALIAKPSPACFSPDVSLPHSLHLTCARARDRPGVRSCTSLVATKRAYLRFSTGIRIRCRITRPCFVIIEHTAKLESYRRLFLVLHGRTRGRGTMNEVEVDGSQQQQWQRSD